MKFYNKHKILIVGGLAIVAISVLTFVVSNNHSKDPSLIIKTINRDTGELIYDTPNITPEIGSPASDNFTVFGSYLLLDNGATDAQFAKIKDLLLLYASSNLGSKYSSLTIIPQGFERNGGVIKSQMRLGNSDKVAQLTVDISELTLVRILINSNEESALKFDSGKVAVDIEFYR